MSTTYLAGVDEAGRGSVLGPLVVCVAVCPRIHIKQLKIWGKKDSKQLSPSQRESTFKELKKFCDFKFVEISAEKLTQRMATHSLNDIEAEAMAALIKNLKDCDTMIDLPDRYEWTFRRRMDKLGVKKFEAQHKADENYESVAAASICAKLLRDQRIAEIAQTHGPFGSGYPSDPYTIAALRDPERRKTLHPFIRHRWKTIEALAQKKLFEE